DYVIRTSNCGIDHSDILVEPLRHKLMSFYEQILLFDLNCARVNNALQLIWQHCFYQFIDHYRNEHKKHPVNVTISPAADLAAKRNLALLTSIISEGKSFFDSLRDKLGKTYN